MFLIKSAAGNYYSGTFRFTDAENARKFSTEQEATNAIKLAGWDKQGFTVEEVKQNANI